LKLLKEVWLGEEAPNGLLTHVSNVQDRLQRANDLTQHKLRESQGKMKIWYDRKARAQTFHPSDRVVMLLPIHGNPDTVDHTQLKRRPVSLIMLSILLTEGNHSEFTMLIC